MIALDHWATQPLALAPAAVLVLHEYGRRRLAADRSDERPAAESARQAWLFRIGAAWAALTLVSPLGYWSHTVLFPLAGLDASFAMIVAPLVVLGAPWPAFAAAVAAVRPPGGARARRRAPVRRMPGGPEAAAAAYPATLLLWQIPAVLDSTTRSAALWTVQIACYAVAGTLLWLQIVGSHPFQPGWDPGSRLCVITTALTASFIAGAALVFSGKPWYHGFASGPLSNVADQGLAGALIWVLPTVPLGIATFWCFAEWIGQDEDDARLRKALEPAAGPGPKTGGR